MLFDYIVFTRMHSDGALNIVQHIQRKQQQKSVQNQSEAEK